MFDAINKALPFIILPVIAKYLNTSEFGIVSNYLTLYQIAYILITYSTYTRLSTDYYRKDFNLKEGFSNLTHLMGFNFIISLILTCIFTVWIEESLCISLIWQILAIITAYFAGVGNLFTTLLVMKEKSVMYGIIQNLQSILLFFFTLLLVAVIPLNWHGRVIAQVISTFVLSVFAILIAKQKFGVLSFSLNKDLINVYYKWGFPLLPHTLALWLKSGMDKILVTKFLGLAINGVFSLSMTLGSIMSLITTSFFNVYSPYVFKQLSIYQESDVQGQILVINKLRKQFMLFILGYGLLSIVSYYVLKIIISLFFSGDYLIAITYLPWVLFANFVNSIYTVFSSFLFYNRKNKFIATTTIASAIIQIVLNLLLLPAIGVLGVLIANVLSTSYVAVLTIIGARKQYPLLFYKNYE